MLGSLTKGILAICHWSPSSLYQCSLVNTHIVQINRDYESVKMLDLGMPSEDVKQETEDHDSDTSSCTNGDGDERDQGKGVKREALASKVEDMKKELCVAKEQIAHLVKIQEAIAREVLSQSEVKRLFDKSS